MVIVAWTAVSIGEAFIGLLRGSALFSVSAEYLDGDMSMPIQFENVRKPSRQA